MEKSCLRGKEGQLEREFIWEKSWLLCHWKQRSRMLWLSHRDRVAWAGWVKVSGTLSNDDDGCEIITKNEFASFQTLLRLFGTAQFLKCRRLFLELNSLGLYSCSNREGTFCRCMSTSSIKRRIGRFHVVFVQWTSKKCTKKRDARAEQLFFS